MKRTTIVAASVILILGVGLMLGLNRYKVVLIHTIVENALVQKAPAGYPQAEIRRVFDENYRKAQRTQRQELYLQRLLKTSQRLEKIQTLDSNQVREILRDLDPPGGP